LSLAAEDDAARLLGERFSERFRVGTDDLEIEQNHAQLLQLFLHLCIGRAQKLSGIVKNRVRVLLHLIEALDNALKLFEIGLAR